MTRKPYKSPHYGRVKNRHTFAQAYREVSRNCAKIYRTSSTRSPFIPFATIAKLGNHKGEKVIIFKTREGQERARCYPCCWGHITNCNRTYIDRYSSVL